MRTGALRHTGASINKEGRQTIYLEKYYPIEGRTDFFKWVVVTPQGLARDFSNKVMYFDEFNLEQAKAVVRAKRKVCRLNNKFLNN